MVTLIFIFTGILSVVNIYEIFAMKKYDFDDFDYVDEDFDVNRCNAFNHRFLALVSICLKLAPIFFILGVRNRVSKIHESYVYFVDKNCSDLTTMKKFQDIASGLNFIITLFGLVFSTFVLDAIIEFPYMFYKLIPPKADVFDGPLKKAEDWQASNRDNEEDYEFISREMSRPEKKVMVARGALM